MRIKCGHSGITKVNTEIHEFKSGTVDILADDGRPLFHIHQNQDGSIDVSAGSFCKHCDVMLDTGIVIKPIASNTFNVSRSKYEERKA